MVNANTECLRCGKCCKMIPMLFDFDSFADQYTAEEIEFMKEHWHPISAPEEKPNRFSGSLYNSAKWFCCDMLDLKTGQCKCYETRPRFCREYPSTLSKSTLIFDGCGFMPVECEETING